VLTDGALPAKAKALFAAAVAASKGQEEQLREYLTAAREAGLTTPEVWGGASVVLTSRGEAVAERFAVAAIELFGSPEPVEAQLGPDLGEADAYLTEYYGAIPPRFAFMRDVAPQAFVALYLVHRGSLKGEGLDPILRELIVCAVNAADFQPDLMAIHAGAAVKLGATKQQVAEAVLAALPVAGMAVWSKSADTIAAL
jgi:alkylhydroperoxidase/carboxymuconolactone decarboxylase family protein YurZ